MDQNLPDFEQTQPAADAPKKPRRKPPRKIAKPSKRALPKPVRRARKVRVKIPPTLTVVTPLAPKMSIAAFLRNVAGIKLQPWQERMLIALVQEDK